MSNVEPSLDPEDWTAIRAFGHRMLDDMIDQMASVRQRPVWQKMPAELRTELRTPLPRAPGDLGAAYRAFHRLVQPYVVGNTHPRFMGWVHGGGNVVGMLAEMLAAGLNANLGGRDHAPIEVERQVIRWTAEILGFPLDATGLFVTGASFATLIGLLVARTAVLGPDVRCKGLESARLMAYASTEVHRCVVGALDIAGLGTEALRLIPCDVNYRIDLAVLAATVKRDRETGSTPFLVIGSAGTVNVGAVDNLAGLASFCRQENLWFHVDGALGALAMLAPSLRPQLQGIGEADSIACDFHKLAQAPYDAGCILVRDSTAQLATFASPAAYLRQERRGIAAGYPWPCDLGPDLSRGFRALKIWMMLQVYGADELGRIVEHCCALAKALAARIDDEQELERLAPVTLNIVCFRYRAAEGDLDHLNAELVADLQESGIAAPSTTTIGGHTAIRAAFVNHRTKYEDVDILVDAVLKIGRKRCA